ncbi:diacylglycerol kinase family protein [Azospirillum sp. SYSU D00513]|uniref:diacylglycerol kinase family protein n=1 Tax=Azospirillum sp. SYSU D00513 TaxID=2812561 RepID=UPI001A975289|nr:diacylglycerol kinase family protein [Azospirillum sp. SYSU D00513]
MIRVGVISNPRSLANRRAARKGSGFAAVAAGFPGLLYAQPGTPAELQETLAEFHRREVGVIGVHGGDGTIREVLTALPRSYGESWPDIALLPAGKTNLAARVLGSAGRGGEGLARLLDAARQRSLGRVEAPVMEIAWTDAPERRMSGFLFGAGAFSTGTKLAYSHVHAAGINSGPAVALTIAAAAASILVGKGRRDMLAGEEMSLALDGAPQRPGRRFLTLASTFDRLALGIRPFWGEGKGSLRWLDVLAPPRRLMRALVPVLRGRPRPWMTESSYTSGRADRLALALSSPFVVDGELFDPGPAGITLSADRRVGFVTP